MRMGTALFLCGLGAATAARAQSAEEPGATAPERRGLVRSLEALYARASVRFHEWGLHPRLGNISSNGGPAPGLAYWHPGVGGSSLDAFASASRSFRGDQLLEIRLGRIPHRPGDVPSRRDGLEWISAFEAGPASSRYFLYGEIRRMDFADYRLDGEPTTLGQTSYDLVTGYRLSGHISASLRAGRLEVESGQVESQNDTVGFVRESFAPGWRRDYFRVATEIAFDDRDHPRNPHRGRFASVSLERYQDSSEVSASFGRVTLDARRYQSLGSPRHVLAIHGLASAVNGCSGEDVPAFLRRSLGGGSTLRGFSRDRFAGDRLLALSAEYRFEVFRAWELAAFYDVGKAWGGPAALTTNGFANSYGLGFRFKAADQVLVRLDLGRSPEGTRAHLKFGYSF